MSKRIAVIGAGSWGGWSAFKLQEAGYDVTLIDKSTPGNSLSGSGGRTRIIRMAYVQAVLFTLIWLKIPLKLGRSMPSFGRNKFIIQRARYGCLEEFKQPMPMFPFL